MGEFKDASLWLRLAFLMITLGFLLDLFAFATGMGAGGHTSTEACMVIGFLCFIVGFVLALCLIFVDELKDNKPALICLIIFAFIAGIITIIGLAIWGGNFYRGKGYVSSSYSYACMQGAVGGLLAILAGIFAILKIAGVKGG